MMFDIVPALSAPTVTTAKSPGFVSRETIDCNLSTIEEASTTGSTDMCGIEPCAPFPYTVILSESPAERTGPSVVATVPAGIGITCWARATTGRGTLVTSPSSTIALAPAPISSAGWNRAM
jgi:hypothetical protein